MKKILALVVLLATTTTINSQILEVYKGTNLVATFTPEEADNFVFKTIVKVTGVNISAATAEIDVYRTLQLSAAVIPANATFQTLTWQSSDPAIASVDKNGLVTAASPGTANITATATDGTGISATYAITVKESAETHEYVDLGLPSGTLWATCNIGADRPEDYGDYFAWGETSGYNSGKKTFSSDTYSYYNETKPDTIIEKDNHGFETRTIVYHQGYTKYVNYSDASSFGYDGFYDNKTTLEPSDDAATANWGSKWKIPTATQWLELINKCNWTWCFLNNVNGYKVTGTNGNYIFLPTTGSRSNSSLNNAGASGVYWSSSLREDYSDQARYLFFYSSGRNMNDYYRFSGYSVRPVTE